MFFIRSDSVKIAIAGLAAGLVGGLLGAGGGLVLVPLLERWVKIPPRQVFSVSLSVMLAVTATSLTLWGWTALPWEHALPYLLGGAVGGILAGKTAGSIPVLWLHRGLGGLMLLAGIRALW